MQDLCANFFLLGIALAGWLIVAATEAHAEQDTGQRTYLEWCAPCHADSPFAPGTIQLKARQGAARSVLLTRQDLTPAQLRSFVRDGFGGMPKFRRTEISDAALDALIEFLVKP